MNIALLYPEALDLARFGEVRKEFPPMGVMILASRLEEGGHVVKIYKVNEENIYFNFKHFDIVGFSLSSSATYSLMKKARFTSLFGSSTRIIAGGLHATLYPKEVFHDMELDTITIGDADHTILDIVNATSYSDKLLIPNLIFRKNDTIYESFKSKVILKNWSIPARHLLPYNDIFLKDRLANTNIKMAHVLFSRGCNGNCYFCAVPKEKTTYQNVKLIEKELYDLKNNFDVEGVAIIDNNFFAKIEYTSIINKVLFQNKLNWSALARVEDINEYILKIAKRSGCLEIKFGIESGSQNLLNEMNKKITIDQIEHALSFTKKNGINTKITLIHGFPGENYRTTIDTMRFIQNHRRLIDRISLIKFVPLPGSYVFKNPGKYKLINNIGQKFQNINWSSFHLYNNDYHWWGSHSQFQEVQYSFRILAEYIDSEYSEGPILSTDFSIKHQSVLP